MRRSISSTKCYRNIINNQKPPSHSVVFTRQKPPCEVFINHRGIDTKKGIAGLLYYHLIRTRLRGVQRKRKRLRPFLDSKNMKPGDKLFDKLDTAISECKVAVAVFSPRYCKSYFCLHELALIMELKKKVIPVFCDVKPSELIIKDNWGRPKHEIDRLQSALEVAKYTVGLDFDSSNGDWPKFLKTATKVIIENLMDVEAEEQQKIVWKSSL